MFLTGRTRHILFHTHRETHTYTGWVLYISFAFVCFQNVIWKFRWLKSFNTLLSFGYSFPDQFSKHRCFMEHYHIFISIHPSTLIFLFFLLDAASKHAAVGFFDCLRAEMEEFDISVSTVNPTFIYSYHHQPASGNWEASIWKCKEHILKRPI